MVYKSRNVSKSVKGEKKVLSMSMPQSKGSRQQKGSVQQSREGTWTFSR